MTRKRRLRWRLCSIRGLAVPSGKTIDAGTRQKKALLVERAWYSVQRSGQSTSVSEVQSERATERASQVAEFVYRKAQSTHVELIEIETEPKQISAWTETEVKPLSESDTELVLSLIENPPEPSQKLINAMRRFQDEFEM